MRNLTPPKLWLVAFLGTFLLSVSAHGAMRDPTLPLVGMGNGTLSATVKSDQQDALTLESIFISDKRKLAVINGQTVSINQTINGVFIKNITAKEVTVRHKGQDKKLHIIKPLLKTRNGARQG